MSLALWGAAQPQEISEPALQSFPQVLNVNDVPVTDEPFYTLDVQYSPAMQPLVTIMVGGQPLRLIFDVSSSNTLIFVEEFGACMPTNSSCFSYQAAERFGGLGICAANNDDSVQCVAMAPEDAAYPCNTYAPSILNTTSHLDELQIEGVSYRMKGVEAVDSVSIAASGSEASNFSWGSLPVRLLTYNISVSRGEPAPSLVLFNGTEGLLGAGGRSLSCRNTTIWHALSQRVALARFALDFRPPPAATIQDPGPSRVVLNQIDPVMLPQLVWSEPKQGGDLANDGMREFLLFHPEVCGIDLMYNVSSNWLVVIDTSGPCLALPPFLFEAFRTHVPIDCPFQPGQKANGQLCSPRRVHGGAPLNVSLPSLSFALQDSRTPPPPRLQLPLERLVFRNSTGHEQLCVARQDYDAEGLIVDMMYSHIALGSMVASALYTVIDLHNSSIGLASKGNPATESTEAYCSTRAVCVSDMQQYFPPLNVCQDPDCSSLVFMVLDETTKTCRWNRAVPVALGVVLVGLVVADLVSHRLYKEAVGRASAFNQ